MFVEFTSFIL